jgi:Flp pilus assembly protein TadD
VVVASACASRQGSFGKAVITPDEILAGAPLGLEEIAPEVMTEEREVLALSTEMHEFLDAHVDRRGTRTTRLHQLVSAIIDSGTFGLVYDDSTRTASETFHLRQGNCLSFSNMFVALARNVGLHVQYQEVDVPPDWTLDKDTFVLNRHINVIVDLEYAGTRVVDFNIGDFKTSYDMRKISDARALAHFYNNMGVERLQADDTAAAFLFFRRAITDNDRLFSPAWTNVGTLYRRKGLLSHAEAAYLQALEARKCDLVAMSNLVRLYELLGDQRRAAAYRKKVTYHRMRNPYYRYGLAREALTAKDLEAAIGHLKFAIRKRPREDRFCFLLGLAYMRQGEEKAARHWFDRAKELAATATRKHVYSDKIDTLLRQGRGDGHP